MGDSGMQVPSEAAALTSTRVLLILGLHKVDKGREV